MNRNLSLWQFGGFAFTMLMGTLLHFIYGWTNKCLLFAPFSAVNESTFEHMKLLYFPMLFSALFQSRFFYEYKNFWCIKLFGIITGLLLIPILFYTVNGVFGKSPDWLNITFFFVSAGVAFLLEWKFFKNNTLNCKIPWLAFTFICIIGVMFAFFTFAPPKIPLFKDPISQKYGLS